MQSKTPRRVQTSRLRRAAARGARAVLFVVLGVLAGVGLTYLLVPGDGMVRRLPLAPAPDYSAVSNVRAARVVAVLFCLAALVFLYLRRRGAAAVLIAASVLLALAQLFQPPRPVVLIDGRPADAVAPRVDPSPPHFPPVPPGAGVPERLAREPIDRPGQPAPVAQVPPRGPIVSPARDAPPDPHPEPAPEPSTASAPPFPTPEGCRLETVPALPGSSETSATCGFSAENGNTRLLELRQRDLPLADPSAPPTAAQAASELLKGDRPEPVVVQLSGYDILSYRARAVDAGDMPPGFLACIRATEVRREIADQSRAPSENGAGPSLEWTEMRQVCRGLAPSGTKQTEITLILREGHMPGDLSADFETTGERLFADAAETGPG